MNLIDSKHMTKTRNLRRMSSRNLTSAFCMAKVYVHRHNSFGKKL